MKFDWIQKRQTKYSAYAATYVLVILAVLGAVNFLANRYDKSYDSTSNKQFSLSEQTIKVVKGLKNDVNVTYFDETRNFPQGRDLLDRYAALSPKLHVQYVDPVRKPQQARADGYSRDTLVLVANGVRKETAKSLTEEEVTGALIRSLKSGDRVAYFVTGSGEHGIDDSARSGYQAVKDALEKSNFKTKTINLIAGGAAAAPAAPATIKPGAPAASPAAAAPAVPADCSVLVVAGPKYAYTKPEVDAIKNYVENGGHALFLLDPPLNMGKDETSANPDLANLLASWGVTVNKDLALDMSGVGQLFGLGPEVPLVTSYESHPIVRDMKDIATAFPLARTLDVKNGDKTSVEKLFSTSDNSFETTDLNSNQIRIDPKKDKKGPFTLAAAGTYNGAKQGRFVVVGSSMWAGNSFIRFNGNRDLFLNTVNWLTADEDLISIRPKQPDNRPLNMTARGLSSVFWLSVVFFPLGVVTSGAMVWWKRR